MNPVFQQITGILNMHLWLVKRQITIFTNDDIRDKGQVKLARKLISIEPRSFLLLAGWLLIVT